MDRETSHDNDNNNGGYLVFVPAFKRFLGKDNVTTELEEAQAESQAQNNAQTISVLGLLRSKAVRWQIITVIVSVPSSQFSGGSAVRFHSYIEIKCDSLFL